MIRTGEIALARAPEWSPDGNWVAWVDPDTEKLEVMRLDGSDRRTIDTPPAGSVFTDPTWSSEGNRLAYLRLDFSNLATTSGAVIVADLIVTTKPELPLANGRGAERPTWSPDGKRVAVCVPVGSPLILRHLVRREIQIWTVATGAIRVIGDLESSDCSPTWGRSFNP